MTTYGAWLRHQRTERGLSQEALGDLVGVDGTYINKIENHLVKRPYAPLRSRIHAVFGTSDSDPDLLPLLSQTDQRQAMYAARSSERTPGQRLDQLLAVLPSGQRATLERMLRDLEVLLLNGERDATIPYGTSGDNP